MSVGGHERILNTEIFEHTGDSENTAISGKPSREVRSVAPRTLGRSVAHLRTYKNR